MVLSVGKNRVGNQMISEKEPGKHPAVHLQSESRLLLEKLRSKKQFLMSISSNKKLPYKCFSLSLSV